MSTFTRMGIVFSTVGLLFFSACGSDINTPFSGAPTDVGVSSGGDNWQPITPVVNCTPSPSPSASPNPSPNPAPSPSPAPSDPGSGDWWCRLAHWLPGCEKYAAQDLLDPPGEPVVCTTTTPTPPTHNTKFCRVDEKGEVISGDYVTSDDSVHSVAGGCIKRPIREAWAVMLNMESQKPDNVDEYSVTPRPDLTNPAIELFFAFDIHLQHNVPLINPSWTVRWYHFIPKDQKTGQYLGTYEDPLEVAVRFQKIDGTGYIKSLSGTYLLDRVTDDVTGFLMVQDAQATQYGKDDGYHDVLQDMNHVRTLPPNWSALPAHWTK